MSACNSCERLNKVGLRFASSDRANTQNDWLALLDLRRRRLRGQQRMIELSDLAPKHRKHPLQTRAVMLRYTYFLSQRAKHLNPARPGICLCHHFVTDWPLRMNTAIEP